jgi:hypothetical protein
VGGGTGLKWGHILLLAISIYYRLASRKSIHDPE